MRAASGQLKNIYVEKSFGTLHRDYDQPLRSLQIPEQS